jgi:hypothetical protein
MHGKKTIRPIVFSDEYNNIVWDIQKSKKVSKKLNKECCALKEVNLGYGVYFTKDGFFGGYGDSDVLREEICSYLDITVDLTEEQLKNAKTLQDFIGIGIIKLLSCSYAETRMKATK